MILYEHKVVGRIGDIENGAFEAAESRQYLFDSIEKAADVMEEMLVILGYAKLVT